MFLIAQHVSSDIIAHHQKLKNLFAASGFTYVFGCRPLRRLSGNRVPTQPSLICEIL